MAKIFLITAFLFGTSVLSSPIPKTEASPLERIINGIRNPSAIVIRENLPPGGVVGNADIAIRNISEKRVAGIDGGLVGNAGTKDTADVDDSEKRALSQVGGLVGNAGVAGTGKVGVTEKRDLPNVDNLSEMRR